MNITELVKKAHDNAVEKGFYDCPECDGQGYIVRQKRYDEDNSGVVDFYGNAVKEKINCNSCNGTGKNPNKNVGELLMLVVSELGEALEAHRKDKYANIPNYEKCMIDNVEYDFGGDHFECWIKDSFEDELAYAVIRIADMCGYLGIDLEKHIELKMKYNATREYKHGKRY